MSFNGKAAFAMGASSIGRATARLLGSHGAKVAAADLQVETAGATAEEFVAAGGSARGLGVDVASKDQVSARTTWRIQHF